MGVLVAAHDGRRSCLVQLPTHSEFECAERRGSADVRGRRGGRSSRCPGCPTRHVAARARRSGDPGHPAYARSLARTEYRPSLTNASAGSRSIGVSPATQAQRFELLYMTRRGTDELRSSRFVAQRRATPCILLLTPRWIAHGADSRKTT